MSSCIRARTTTTSNQVVFEDLGIRRPDHFLDASGPTAAKAIAEVISRAAARDWTVFRRERTPRVLVVIATQFYVNRLGIDGYGIVGVRFVTRWEFRSTSVEDSSSIRRHHLVCEQRRANGQAA